jgi:hypothetical protein
MQEPLSRRAFIRVAAAIGTVTSFLGFEPSAQSAPTPTPSPSTPPTSPKLHDVCYGCFRLHKYRGLKHDPSFHVKGPTLAGDLGNEATSKYFSAQLIKNVAANTLHVRDHIRKCEPISDQKQWDPPNKLASTNPIVIQRSIDRWIAIQYQLFRGMLVLYPVLEGQDLFDGQDEVQPLTYEHDEYYRLAYCGVEFIKGENKDWSGSVPFDYDNAQSPPKPNEKTDDTLISSLVDLEWGFHQFVLAQMEIASFMPEHFNINEAAACAGGGGEIK